MSDIDTRIQEIRDDMIRDALAGTNGPAARSLAAYCVELRAEREAAKARIADLERQIDRSNWGDIWDD